VTPLLSPAQEQRELYSPKLSILLLRSRGGILLLPPWLTIPSSPRKKIQTAPLASHRSWDIYPKVFNKTNKCSRL